MNLRVKIISINAGLALLSSCSSTVVREPASVTSPPSLDQSQGSLISSIDVIQNDIELPTFGDNCVTYLQGLETQMGQTSAWQFLPEDTSDAKSFADKLWKLQLTLHDFLASGTPDCAREIKNATRLLRFSIDYLKERSLAVQPLDPSTIDYASEELPIQDAAAGYSVYTRSGTPLPFQFRNGDLILSRSVSFVDALNSHIGGNRDIGGQFSSVKFVHVDSQSGKVETIESYIGIGVQIYDIDSALKSENSRLLILRPKDQDLANRAADFIYSKVKTAVSSGRSIAYDYGMDSEDHVTLSAQEIPQAAFEGASDGATVLPQYHSHIATLTSFLRQLGLSEGRIFTVNDLEVDPRFNLMAEWRDLRTTQDSRQKDAILNSILKWMSDEGYQLQDSSGSKINASALHRLRSTFIWPAVQKNLRLENYTSQIPHGMLQNWVLMNRVAGILLDQMRIEDAAFQKAHGWPMSYHDLSEALETFRQTDLANWKNPSTRNKSRFTSYFHP